jgi:hypothetical protein
MRAGEGLSKAQRQAVERLLADGRVLKWDGQGTGYMVPGWTRMFSMTLRALSARGLLKRTNAEPDEYGFHHYEIDRRLYRERYLLRCSRCGMRKPDGEFNRDRRKRRRRGRASYCRDCERSYKQEKNGGRPEPDDRTTEEQFADARAKLDPGPLYDLERAGL